MRTIPSLFTIHIKMYAATLKRPLDGRNCIRVYQIVKCDWIAVVCTYWIALQVCDVEISVMTRAKN